jgi:hypothetical protein
VPSGGGRVIGFLGARASSWGRRPWMTHRSGGALLMGARRHRKPRATLFALAPAENLQKTCGD